MSDPEKARAASRAYYLRRKQADHEAYVSWLRHYIRIRDEEIPLYRRQWSAYKRMRAGAS